MPLVWLLLATLPVTFHDAARDAGITFVHDMGLSGQRMMVETMGSGAGFIDYDNDGDLDVYLINGAPLPGYKGPAPLTNALYRNDGGVRFTDVTAESGTGDTGYGMGMCAGDYDNDGFTDLYLSNYGPNVLYHNEGNGKFETVTADAGVGDPSWGSSCAFIDYDRDGDLDLYITNYVDWTPENDKFCGDYAKNVKAYCHPNVYHAQPDILYRNNGDGTFQDVGAEAGIRVRLGNGLGVVTGDYDNDGDMDIYVANDKSPNMLFLNNGNGTFTDMSLTAGVGYSVDGETQAGMGTDFGDYDGDGDLDIVVTNLDFEYNALYRNEGGGIFSDMSFAAGIGAVSMSYVGFGVAFLDYDNDGRVDLAVANGHILDNATYFNDATTYAERPFLFHGIGNGRFAEVGEQSGEDMKLQKVARGLSVGDVDNDGDLDMLMSVSGGTPRLMVNSGPAGNHWIGLRLIGTASDRSALGTRITVPGPYGELIEELKGGGSFQSQADMRLHVGLGATVPDGGVPVEIRWSSGTVEKFTIDPVDRYVTVVEGKGVIAP